jgi:hypothetical protein
MLDSGCEAREGVLAAGGRGDGGGQAVVGRVVDDRADPPDPTCGGLELGEVSLPDLRSVGGSSKTRRRIAAQDLRSARNPRGNSNPRRRKARSTVELDTG